MEVLQTRSDAFTSFVKEVEPRLRFALVAAAGPDRGLEGLSHALAYGWEHWDKVSVMENPDTRDLFEALWQTSDQSALDRYKLYKLAWDLLGTDFGGRHLQYERFYMGPAFVVRGHNNRECAWDEILEYVDDLLGSYGPGPILDRGISE